VRTYLVTCVRTLPRTVEKIAPIGAPAEKVANAMEREGPGGNALARIPSWWESESAKVRVCEQTTRKILTEAGIIAAEPIPCIPRSTSSAVAAVISTCENDISRTKHDETKRTLSEAGSNAKHHQNQVSNKPHSFATVEVCQSATEKKEACLCAGST